MSEQRKFDGGPAFPQTVLKQSQDRIEEVGCSGMTIRDYFAAKAMNGLLSANITVSLSAREMGITSEELIAKFSYKYADAMLKESGR